MKGGYSFLPEEEDDAVLEDPLSGAGSEVKGHAYLHGSWTSSFSPQLPTAAL